MRRALLFANLKSGRASALPTAIDLLQKSGVAIEYAVFDLSDDSIARHVRETRDQVDLVLAFGGDGTIGAVVNGTAKTDMVTGVIAGGTSNNFVRSLGIRPSIRGCVEAIRAGRALEIDLGQVNGRYFAHAAIMGLNVEFAREAQRYRSMVGRLSYPIASMAVYRSRRQLDLTVTRPGETKNLKTYQLAILNADVFGGPLNVSVSGADVVSHSLRAVTVDDPRLRVMVRDLPRVFFERHLGLPGGESFELTECEITSPDPVEITLDGEIATETPARIGTVPKALRVIVGPDRAAQP